MKITVATSEEAEFIDNEIVEYNKAQVPFTQKETPLFKNFVIKDHGKIIAGVNACIYHWGILYIDVLFVHENYRGQNLGRQLLDHIESEAISIGAYMSHLDTFDFQAKDFYLKHGYEVFGTLENCPSGHNRFYLKKMLQVRNH